MRQVLWTENSLLEKLENLIRPTFSTELVGRRKWRTLADRVIALISKLILRSTKYQYAVAARSVGDPPDLDNKAIDLGQLVHMLNGEINSPSAL